MSQHRIKNTMKLAQKSRAISNSASTGFGRFCSSTTSAPGGTFQITPNSTHFSAPPSTRHPHPKSLAPFYQRSTSTIFGTRTALQQSAGHSQYRSQSTMASATSFFDFEPKDKKGAPYPLTELKGKVVLVVNTASKCGFTPQFEGLEKLYKGMYPRSDCQYLCTCALTAHRVRSDLTSAALLELKPAHPDFEILGFPCNQFGSQDPGTDDEIQSFCQVNYGVSFPVLGKTEVNGDNTEPVWEWMKKSKPGIMGLQRVKWNFEKFLIGKDGKVVQRWASTNEILARFIHPWDNDSTASSILGIGLDAGITISRDLARA
nr:glutathione peroxidase [Quercus suber]